MNAVWDTLQKAGRTTALSSVLLGIPTLALADNIHLASTSNLSNFSLEELADIDITSVSKRSEKLSDAAAAIFVITHEDIMRSGATSIPEILRLAPNLQVAQMGASSYAITARGFNGNAADKLLVLIDGRSVYTPLYGGVLWDEKDVLPEDIDRIEVISGPGATLWGANAVNGVINIITRKSSDTPGGVLDIGLGNRETQASLQYGGKLASDLSYRIYLEGFAIRGDKTSTGADAYDSWYKPQGGFRVDWTPPDDTLTVQGDLYQGSEAQSATLHEDIAGGNLQATWQHQLSSESSVQVLAYYDETRRFLNNYGGYSLNTYDVELQHSFSPFDGNDVVWGAGYRLYRDQFTNFGAVQFLPAGMSESLADIFAQDSIALTPVLKLTLGMKLENDPYSGLAPLPNGRISWKLDDDVLLWSAVSRAVRAPTLFDEDISDTLIPAILILTGNRDFQPEKLSAYEIGTRVKASSAVSFSVSTFYNVYDDLRSVEWARMTTLPLLWTWGNLMEGNIYGVEVWGDYRMTDWWHLTAGFNIQHEALRFKPGASSLNSIASAGDDPNHQASLHSSVNLGPDVTWHADLRYVGALPSPVIPSYIELNTKLAWTVSPSLQISVAGFNLLHAHHLEYEEAGATMGDEVDRTVYVETKWRF